MRISLDTGAVCPTRAHPSDAGLDIHSPREAVVCAHDSLVIPTGVHVELPPGTAGLVVSKSGLLTNHGITSTGLIDEGYDGEIVVTLINHSNEDYHIYRGDKITQLVVFPVMYPIIELVDKIDTGSERGSRGFGSSGK